MLFRIADDWKQLLAPEDEAKMNAIIRSVGAHRSAYRASKDIKTAQLWCAVLEMKKENALLHRRLKRMEYIFEGIADRIRSENLDEKSIIEALEKF